MAWIESHQNLKDHPKTLKLSILMGWDIDTTIGKLHRLWWWCLDYCADGNVSRQSADMVALAVGLLPEAGEKLINSLYLSEYLDKTTKKEYLIHDWLDYAGRYLRDTKYRRSPEKLLEIKALYATIVSRQSADKSPKKALHVSRQSAVPNLPNLPNLPKDILSQVEEEFKKFTLSKKGIDSFMSILASQNKTGLITESRKLSLLCQLSDVLAETGDETVFNDALLEMTGKGIANINYLKQVIRSRKKGGNSGGAGSRQVAQGKTREDSTESDKYDGLGTVINLGG